MNGPYSRDLDNVSYGVKEMVSIYKQLEAPLEPKKAKEEHEDEEEDEQSEE
jgi:hypothetical protein